MLASDRILIGRHATVKHATKLGLAALIVVGVVVAFGIWKSVSHRNRRQDIANALKLAGSEANDAGVIILTPDAGGGLALAYDPNLYDPSIGHRSIGAASTESIPALKRPSS